ncbi:MAG: hypothetical protein ACT4QC_20485 [Planctomycetaceae bacterium]
MSRMLLKSALVAAAAVAIASIARADEDDDVQQVLHTSAPRQQMTYGQVANGVPVDALNPYAYNFDGCYPPIRASMYPCPRPDVPREVGWTMITSPAFSPHEMLYAHTYRALYPPYYYRNKCGLACIPFMPKCKLKGTEVTIKYKSCCGWRPPISRVLFSNRGWNSECGTDAGWGRAYWNR